MLLSTGACRLCVVPLLLLFLIVAQNPRASGAIDIQASCPDGLFRNASAHCVPCPSDTFSSAAAAPLAESLWLYEDFEPPPPPPPPPVGSMQFNVTVEDSNSTGLAGDVSSAVSGALNTTEGDVSSQVVDGSGARRRLLSGNATAPPPLFNFTVIVTVKVRDEALVDSIAELRESRDDVIKTRLQERRGSPLRMRSFGGGTFTTRAGETFPARPAERVRSAVVFALEGAPSSDTVLEDIRRATAEHLRVSIFRVQVVSFADGVATVQITGVIGADPTTIAQNMTTYSGIVQQRLRTMAGWDSVTIPNMVPISTSEVQTRAAKPLWQCCVQTEPATAVAPTRLLSWFKFDNSLADSESQTKLIKEGINTWQWKLQTNRGVVWADRSFVGNADLVFRSFSDASVGKWAPMYPYWGICMTMWLYPTATQNRFFLYKDSKMEIDYGTQAAFFVQYPKGLVRHRYDTVPLLTKDRWHHVAWCMTLSGTNTYVYVNNVRHDRFQTGTSGIPSTFGDIIDPFTSGPITDQTQTLFKGRLLVDYSGYVDDLRIYYNKVLSAAEVRAIYFESFR